MYLEASAELIARARHDRAAFAEVYDLYLRRVYTFCLSRCRNSDEAEDLTAQTFERALHAIGRYDDRGKPLSSWLFTIAAHLVVDHARERARNAGGDVSLDTRHDTGGGPEAQVAEWESDLEMRSLIATLPPEQQRALQLRYWQERSIAEVAREMGRNENAAKQLLHRAIRTLRLRLGEGTLHG